MSHSFLKLTLLSTAFLFSLPDANAQLAPRDDPARFQERVPEAFKPNLFPEVDGVSPIITEQDIEEAVDDPQNAINFTVSRIIIEGNTVFSKEDLSEEIYKGIGDDITLFKLKNVAAAITRKYRAEGYPFAKAYIPPQTLENETVKILIAEGKIGDIDIRNIEPGKFSRLNAYKKKIMSLDPIREDQLERYVLLINDLPGLSAKAIVNPIRENPGQFQLILLVDEKQGDLAVSGNNRGSDAIGPIQSTANARIYDFFGHNEESSFTYFTTPIDNELQFFSGSQRWTFAALNGLTVQSNLNYSVSDAGGASSGLDIEGRNSSFNVTATYPFLRSRDLNINGSFAFDAQNSVTEISGFETVNDRLRYLRAALSASQFKGRMINSGRVEVSKGINIAKATDEGNLNASRPLGENNITKITTDLSHTRILSKTTSINARAKGQWALAPVLSAELFGVGGNIYGRAFNFSEIAGDSGYASVIEMQQTIPKLNNKFIQNITVVPFFDFGQVFNEANAVGSDWSAIGSYGSELKFGFFKNFSANFTLAKPWLNDREDEDDNLYGFGSISATYSF